jgi:TfoX/Sxy family transcriptional regulator of competence genes
MEWKKVPPELRALLEANMSSFDCEKRAMFGAPTYFKNGNMFAGIHGDTIIIRLPDKEQKEIMAINKNARPFEPMKGRIMKEYIALPESIYNNGDLLQDWLNRSYRYAASLPPKKRKSSTTREGSK